MELLEKENAIKDIVLSLLGLILMLILDIMLFESSSASDIMITIIVLINIYGIVIFNLHFCDGLQTLLDKEYTSKMYIQDHKMNKQDIKMYKDDTISNNYTKLYEEALSAMCRYLDASPEEFRELDSAYDAIKEAVDKANAYDKLFEDEIKE